MRVILKKKRFASQVKHNYVTGLDENIFIDMFFSFPSKDIKGNPVSISIQNRGSWWKKKKGLFRGKEIYIGADWPVSDKINKVCGAPC